MCLDEQLKKSEDYTIHPFTYVASNVFFETFFENGLIATEVPIKTGSIHGKEDYRIPAGALEQPTDFSLCVSLTYSDEKIFDKQQKKSYFALQKMTYVLRNRADAVILSKTISVSKNNPNPQKILTTTAQKAANAVCEYMETR